MNRLGTEIFVLLMTLSLTGCSAVTAFAKETGENRTASPSDMPVQLSDNAHHSGRPADPAEAGRDDYDSATPSDALKSGFWDPPDSLINALDIDDETFGFILHKLGTAGPLDGAAFRMYGTYEDAVRDENAIWFTSDETWKIYYVCDSSGSQGQGDLTSDIYAGTSYIGGLMPAVYYLVETAAPVGYQKLPSIIQIVIEDEGDVFFGDVTYGAELDEAADGIVSVFNLPGAGTAAMPGTGGSGSRPFYTAGFLCIAASLIMAFRMKKRGDDLFRKK